jgi:hypothetical protein
LLTRLVVSVLGTMRSRMHARRGTIYTMRLAPLPLLLIAFLALSFALIGCGETEEAKAEKTVCEAKRGIESSVQSLQSLTIANATISTVKNDLKSIEENLKKIKGAQGELKGELKEQVEKANAELSAELATISHELTTLTLPEVLARGTAAADKIAASYKNAFASIKC